MTLVADPPSNFSRLGCSSYIDLAVVVDASGSIRVERFPRVLEFITDVLAEFALELDGGEARIGAVTFSESAKLEFPLGR